jgi:hypothetical protein
MSIGVCVRITLIMKSHKLNTLIIADSEVNSGGGPAANPGHLVSSEGFCRDMGLKSGTSREIRDGWES